MAKNGKKSKSLIASGIWCVVAVVVLFGYLGMVMGVPNMLNTIMKTAHDLLLNTVLYLMSICVITGAMGRLKMGRISGRNVRSSSATTPNSTNTLPMAPVITHILIR